MAKFRKSGSVSTMVYGADETRYALIHPAEVKARYFVTVAFGAMPFVLDDEGIRATVMGYWTMRSAKKIAACFVDGGPLK
jgi:hypothetical protein